MVIWHNTPDAARIPEAPLAGERISVWIGTYPIEPGQSVWVELIVRKADSSEVTNTQPASWHSNDEPRHNSYWVAHIGPFESRDRVQYFVRGKIGDQEVVDANKYEFEVA